MATVFFVSTGIYPNIKLEEESDIATAISIAGTTLEVVNTEGFNNGDYIIIGTLGKEITEIVKIVSVNSDTQFTISACKFAHSINDKVRKTPFNQVRFYHSSTETGTYTLEGTENMQVDNDDLATGHQTTLADAKTLYWKSTYYNQTTGDESDVDDSEATLGTKVHYCTSQDVCDYLDILSSKLDQSQISLLIDGVTTSIEDMSNSVFYQKTVTLEYHDGKGNFDDEYFLKELPIISITTLQTTQSAEGTASPSWNTLTDVADYEKTLETGRLAIVNSSFVPTKRRNGLRCTYITGFTSIPSAIRKLAYKMVAKEMAQSEVFSELINSSENIKEKIGQIDTMFIEKTLDKYRKAGMGNT